MSRLLVRPTLMLDEWWDSYAARVLAENGHAPTREYMLGKLEPMVAELVADEVKRKALAGDGRAVAVRAYAGWALPSWAVRGRKSAAAYCPNCFHDQPYVRLGWRLRAVTHCDVHDRALQTRCCACSRLVFHWDLARQVCRCGVALGQSQTTATRADDAAKSQKGSSHRENWLFSSKEALGAIRQPSDGSASTCSEALAVIVLMGRLLPSLAEVRVAGLADEARTATGFIKSLGRTLWPSKASVKELLEALPSAAHLRVALNVILSLRSAEQTGPSVLGQLPLQDWAARLCALGASPAAAERRGLVEVGALQRGLVPLKVAALQAGLSEMHLHSLMARGLVAPTRTFEVGGRQHLFSPEQVQFLTSFRHHGYKYGNALDLGFEGSGVHVFRAAGIVCLVPGNHGRTWLDGEALRTLLGALHKRAVEVQTVNARLLNLGSKRIWQRRYIPVLKTLFVRVLAGEVALWANGDQPGFARFYLGVDALELLHCGSAAGGHAGFETQSQPALALSGGAGAWVPTPPPWTRRPPFGAPRASRGLSPQPSLDLF